MTTTMDLHTKLVAVMGDEDTVTGFILAGIGNRTAEGTNFLVVKPGDCFEFSIIVVATTNLMF